MAYFPLADGVLTGKYRRGQNPPEGSRLAEVPYFTAFGSADRLATVERLISFAAERDHTILDLALSWVASRPGVSSVLVGATSPTQVESNVAGLGMTLSHKDLDELDSVLTPQS